MGFLDKLMGKLDPLTDAQVKHYYEIAYGLLSQHTVNYAGIKKYVTYHLGEPCDEEILEKALKCLTDPKENARIYHCVGNRVNRVYLECQHVNTAIINKYLELNKTLFESKAYQCTQEEVYQICYQDLLDTVDKEYCTVLKVVQERGGKHFEEGIKRIYLKYYKVVSETVIKDWITRLTKKYYMAGDRGARIAMSHSLSMELFGAEEETQAAAVALRFVNFHKNSAKMEGYTTFTEKQCRAFVLNNAYFKEQIEENPYETEETTDNYVGEIMQHIVFTADGGMFRSADYWMPDCKTEPFYADKVCNELVLGLAVEYDDVDLTDPDAVYTMLWNYITE